MGLRSVASLINTLLSNPGYLGKKQVRFRSRPKSPCKEEKSLQSLAYVAVAERGEGGEREGRGRGEGGEREGEGTKAEPPSLFPFLPPNLKAFQRLLGRLSILHGQDNNDQIKGSAVEKKPLDKLSSLLSTMPIRIKSV